MIFYSNIYISAKKLKHSLDLLKIQKKTQRGKRKKNSQDQAQIQEIIINKNQSQLGKFKQILLKQFHLILIREFRLIAAVTASSVKMSKHKSTRTLIAFCSHHSFVHSLDQHSLTATIHLPPPPLQQIDHLNRLIISFCL